MPSHIKVDYYENRHTTRQRDPDDSWDRGSTDATIYVTGIQRGDEASYDALPIDYEVKEGQTYHLLYVVYGTGDSFGSDGGKVEFVDLFRTAEEAEENAQRIRYHNDSRRDHGFHERYNVDLISSNGKPYKFGCPWVGYFEWLQQIVVEPVTLAQAGKRLY